MFDQRRLKVVADRPIRSDGQYILYWMNANRRTRYNDALARAIDWSIQLRKPLVVLEALSIDYPWASERHHQFILDGMVDQYDAFGRADVAYYSYVERGPREGRGLVAQLAAHASVLVTDYFPCFFLPSIVAHVGRSIGCRMEAIDANGVLPVNAAGKAFTSAYNFRRFMQKSVISALEQAPEAAPLSRIPLQTAYTPHHERLKRIGVSQDTLTRWAPSMNSSDRLRADRLLKGQLDASVGVLPIRGGQSAGLALSEKFRVHGLELYSERRNDPKHVVTSGLSPYLHFGHISSSEVVHALLDTHGFNPESDTRNFKGQRSGFWELPEPVEAYLDQIITWRELGYGFCHFVPDYHEYRTLPEWALRTLAEHTNDERPFIYTHDQFESGTTHDDLWNAAQNQLRREGKIHNYLRMLWGKKILHWSPTPQDALETMIQLNNKYALDGRNPNSYSGIFWTLGRFDRAWGPEREVFGKVRYMTSASTAKKFSVSNYINTYARGAQTTLGLT
ncbi:MAG: deoxyribodipyrimidine photolyase [Bradymonadia bacterium]